LTEFVVLLSFIPIVAFPSFTEFFQRNGLFIKEPNPEPSAGFYGKKFADGSAIKPPGDNARIVPSIILQGGRTEKEDKNLKNYSKEVWKWRKGYA